MRKVILSALMTLPLAVAGGLLYAKSSSDGDKPQPPHLSLQSLCGQRVCGRFRMDSVLRAIPGRKDSCIRTRSHEASDSQ